MALFALTMIAMGAGFGFVDDDTLWCLHASRLILKYCLFGALGIVYNRLSRDNFTQSFIDFQLKLLMFTAITKYKQVHFIYCALLAYGFGKDKNDFFNYDITRLTAALVLGFNIILAAQWPIMLQTNVFAYLSQTKKLDDGNNDIEFKDNNTWGLFNKNNILAISLVYSFALNSRTR